ncbi:cytochrome P450 [Ktedonospora formicarum]|uniref:Putative cytochrome P450 YjiB n=1 Tax=Ktedonospora formicarum TaxID=2778364 RepID=A0A8J3HWI9_9CHLR|nr:cytochrome P450 [Ktedonospora formicarum]GHO45392.1 putative cytochrome P450 YjiB [Ktedonospora formicarum]
MRQDDQEALPLDWYREMRQSHPVTYDDREQQWMVFRYADVRRVLSEHETFSSEVESHGHTLTPLDVSLIALDPPRHRHLRALVTQVFTPRTVASLEPRLTALVNELLDQRVEAGMLDVIDDLAYPLTVTMIAELLGIPVLDRAHFRRWSDQLASIVPFDGTNFMGEMEAYFSCLLAERRRAPQADLLSALQTAQIEGQYLSKLEILGFCILLLVAGNVTTTHLLGNAFLCLDAFPQVRAHIEERPDQIFSVLEEVLRYRSPIRFMFRVAKRDIVLGGQDILAGQWVTAWLASANHDETIFPDPERFDPQRSPNPHLSFGYGIHYCLGASLARLESRIVLESMVRRFASFQRLPGSRLQPLSAQSFMQGVLHLPIMFASR